MTLKFNPKVGVGDTAKLLTGRRGYFVELWSEKFYWNKLFSSYGAMSAKNVYINNNLVIGDLAGKT